MQIKPLTPSFTCLFHSAESFEQPRDIANILAHNKNMFVTIKGIVVLMSKACMKMWCTLAIIYCEVPLLCSSYLLIPPFIICLITVCQNSHKAHLGKMQFVYLFFLYMPVPSPSFSISLLPTGHSSDTVHVGILLKCPFHHSFSSTVNSPTAHLFSSSICCLLFLFPSSLWGRILAYCTFWHFLLPPEPRTRHHDIPCTYASRK